MRTLQQTNWSNYRCQTCFFDTYKDAQNNRDIKYKNQLKVKILNGQFAGETTTINHQYVKSQADSEAFRTHEKVLLHISNKPSDAYIIERSVIP